VSICDVSGTCESRFVYVVGTLSHTCGPFKMQLQTKKTISYEGTLEVEIRIDSSI
jgi:hypothetical protein